MRGKIVLDVGKFRGPKFCGSQRSGPRNYMLIHPPRKCVPCRSLQHVRAGSFKNIHNYRHGFSSHKNRNLFRTLFFLFLLFFGLGTI